jgi:predicted metalloenzyme YecM
MLNPMYHTTVVDYLHIRVHCSTISLRANHTAMLRETHVLSRSLINDRKVVENPSCAAFFQLLGGF